MTAQVRLDDKVENAEPDKIACTLHYRLSKENKFQQMKITEVALVKSTSWSYIVGWIEFNKIDKHGDHFSAVRLCFDGPEATRDFLVANVVLTQETSDEASRKLNVVK